MENSYKPVPTKWHAGICQKCHFDGRMTIQEPCWSCMANEDLATAHRTGNDEAVVMRSFIPKENYGK